MKKLYILLLTYTVIGKNSLQVRKIATKTKCQKLVELLGFNSVNEALEYYNASVEQREQLLSGDVDEGMEGLAALFE